MALVNVSEIQIQTRLHPIGEPDLGLDSLAMVDNNKLYLWQEHFYVNISDFLIQAPEKYRSRPGYSWWEGGLIWA